MDRFFRETVRYYCALAGVPEEEFFGGTSPVLVRNKLLDGTLPGYGKPVDMLIYERDGRFTVSYSGKGAGFLDIVRNRAGCEKIVRENRGKVKFYYNGKAVPGKYPGEAVRLRKENFPEFAEFFKACNPGCETGDWLEDYFVSIADGGFCFGIYRGGRLACVSDSPDMPIMGDRFMEIGINTLPCFRRQGLAEDVCRAVIEAVISQGYVPLWSADRENAASLGLAEKLVFVRLMNVSEISLR